MPLINIQPQKSSKQTETQLTNIQQEIAGVGTKADQISTKLDNATYGLNAIKTSANTAANNTAANNTASKTGSLSQKESYTISLLENGTYGLNAVNNKLGAASDSSTSTVMGKLNAIPEKVEDINLKVSESVNQLSSTQNLLLGKTSPYGLGTYGKVTYDADKFSWGMPDAYGRYVLQVEELTVPAGVTMTPPLKCDGLYIFSQGDITINGTIDMKGKRRTVDKDPGTVLDYVTINGKQYKLARGGDTVKGGTGGQAGDGWTLTGGLGGEASVETLPGSVIGGGIGTYGTTGSTVEYRIQAKTWSGGKNVGRSYLANNNPPGALILIAKGKITIKGIIDCSATNGVAATDGNRYTTYTNAERPELDDYTSGRGGNGAMPPTGGGCVTLIASAIDYNNGMIDVRGKKETFANGADDSSSKYVSSGQYLYGGKGGKGGTFTSASGQIFSHIIAEGDL